MILHDPVLEKDPLKERIERGVLSVSRLPSGSKGAVLGEDRGCKGCVSTPLSWVHSPCPGLFAYIFASGPSSEITITTQYSVNVFLGVPLVCYNLIPNRRHYPTG